MIVPLNEYDFLKRALVAHAAKEAVVCGDIRLTYAELGDRVKRWAGAMQSLGSPTLTVPPKSLVPA